MDFDDNPETLDGWCVQDIAMTVQNPNDTDIYLSYGGNGNYTPSVEVYAHLQAEDDSFMSSCCWREVTDDYTVIWYYMNGQIGYADVYFKPGATFGVAGENYDVGPITVTFNVNDLVIKTCSDKVKRLAPKTETEAVSSLSLNFGYMGNSLGSEYEWTAYH